MRVLGLCAGNPDGSAEILIKVALGAAAEAGADVALVRLDDLSLPTRPVGPAAGAGEDDGGWLWDQLMESDGLIVSAPIYSRTVPGKLKLVADRLSGPAADVAFAESYRSMLEAGRDAARSVPLRRACVPAARGRLHRRRGRAHEPVEVARAAAHAPDDVLGSHGGRRSASRGGRRDAAVGGARRVRAGGSGARRPRAWASNSDSRSIRWSTAGIPACAPSVTCRSCRFAVTPSSARPAAPPGA